MAHDLIHVVQAFFLPAAGAIQESLWQPAADVYRTPDGWLVKMDLAGVRPEDVQIGVDGSRLIVRGTRRDRCLEEGCRCYSMEIAYSHFERRIMMPGAIDPTRITTEYREGMLLVRIQEAEP